MGTGVGGVAGGSCSVSLARARRSHSRRSCCSAVKIRQQATTISAGRGLLATVAPVVTSTWRISTGGRKPGFYCVGVCLARGLHYEWSRAWQTHSLIRYISASRRMVTARLCASSSSTAPVVSASYFCDKNTRQACKSQSRRPRKKTARCTFPKQLTSCHHFDGRADVLEALLREPLHGDVFHERIQADAAVHARVAVGG
jgi:hypothetical protein